MDQEVGGNLEDPTALIDLHRLLRGPELGESAPLRIDAEAPKEGADVEAREDVEPGEPGLDGCDLGADEGRDRPCSDVQDRQRLRVGG